MRLLQNKWARILLSLLAGAFISELIHVSTGDPNRAQSEGRSMLLFVFAIIIYFGITYLLKYYGKIK